ncbi:MAG TPA: hypothetical protein VKB86_16135, partial [Pyrinomonadaceae bacterium]|nr:hypothetical protein [Pyrinomonadaceae bacterium]
MSHVNVSKTTRHVKPIKSFTTTAGRFVAILALAILFISTLLSASSASSFRSRRNSSSQANSASESKSGVTGKTAVSEHNSSTRNAKELLKGSGGGAASLFSALMPQPVPLSLDSIATYDTDCATPKSSFNLGDTVCVQVSGGPSLTIIPRRIALIDSAGNVRNVIPITSDPQTSTFTLPSTPTTANGSDIYDNRGDWKIN